MASWGTGQWGSGQWGGGEPRCSMTIEISLKAGLLSSIGRTWGQSRWGTERWGASGDAIASGDMRIEMVMKAGVLVPAIVIGGSAGMAIEVTQKSGVLAEITLPAPSTLRLAAWLRPAL